MQENDVLQKQPGETDFEYHKRLIYGKLVYKTLADYDYSELSKYVYEKEFSSDVARRLMYGSKRTLELLDKENIREISGDDVLRELERQKADLQKEQRKFYDQRREYNKLAVFQDSRIDHLYDVLEEAANHLEETVGLLDLFDHDVGNHLITSDNEAVLVFSDWHYGMTADNVFNTFNTEICKERVRNVVALAKERIRLHQCSRLHIVVLGDLFHGAIHVSARVAAEELVCDQIMQVSEILAQAICSLSEVVPEVKVYVTYGNHGRVVQKKEESTHADNFEKIIPWWLRQRLARFDNIEVAEQSDTEFMLINVCGHYICATHGDLDNVHSSPRLLTTLFQKQYGVDIEYVLLGDKHHIESFNELGVTAMLCGSLCGADEYANNKRLFSEPSQLLLIMNPLCGVDAEYRLNCNVSV